MKKLAKKGKIGNKGNNAVLKRNVKKGKSANKRNGGVICGCVM